MRNALRPANTDVSVKRLHNFCINKNKMIIIREDRMLIKVQHQEKGYGSKKLLAEFPNKASEMIPNGVHRVGNLRFQCY